MEDDEKPKRALSRWAQRKKAVAEQEAAEKEAASRDEVTVAEQQARDAELEAELQANREAAEAVDLSQLNQDSDFSVFLKEGVPEMLKKQAMAALWRSNPVFANVDGLVDYDDDFASPDLIMKTFKSAYQAGRGYLDLFKEDEETESQEEAIASSKNEADESENEIPDDVEQTEDEEVIESVTDEEAVSSTQEETETEEVFHPEPEPMPRVSLRKRLELEQQA